jgi:ketosteroid isomerase-like protein
MAKILYSFVLILVTVVVVHAQSNDEKEVTATVDRFINALVNADKTLLEELTATELSYGHSSGKEENKTQFIGRIASGVVDFITIDITDQSIKLAGKIAMVRHVFTSKLVDDGKALDVRIGVMMVWQKQKGKWKLLARQAYKLQ